MVEDAIVEYRSVVVANPKVPNVEKRFELLAVVEYRVVVVAYPRLTRPVAVKLVVEAPPIMEKRPVVMVELPFERKPANVERPVAPRVPKVADWEYRLVEEAVVENKLVVVPKPNWKVCE